MSAILTTRVTQLLYTDAPHLNFAQVVTDLRDALTAPNAALPTLSWDCDDIALLDFNAGRVVVGFTENLPGAHDACLTIASGPSPLAGAAALTDADQHLLCQTVAERLERRFPSDDQQSQSLDQPLTPDLIDQVVDALFETKDTALADDPVSDTAIEPPLTTASYPGDVERLMQRLSQELVTRAPGLISRAIASATPKTRPAADGAQSGAGPAVAAQKPAAATGSVDRRTSMFKGGTFWPKASVASGEPRTDALPATTPQQKRAASGELKAVRDALYAPDQACVGAAHAQVGVQIAAQSKRAFHTLVALPAGLANSIADLRRNDSIGTRIRH